MAVTISLLPPVKMESSSSVKADMRVAPPCRTFSYFVSSLRAYIIIIVMRETD